MKKAIKQHPLTELTSPHGPAAIGSNFSVSMSKYSRVITELMYPLSSLHLSAHFLFLFFFAMEIKGLIPERSSAVEMKAGIIIQITVRKILFLKNRKEMPYLSILKSDEKFPLTSQGVKIRFLKTLPNAPGNASIHL